MKKDTKKPKSKRIKQKAFEDRNLSLIKDHKITNEGGKKKLVPPLMQVEGVQLVSWANDKLPDMLWAALILQALPREDTLVIFRKVISKARSFIDRKDVFIHHTDLAKMKAEEFDLIFEDVLKHDKAVAALNALLLLDGLPDKAQWERHLKPDPENKGHNLAEAIQPCLDHQSQQSVDLKWLKISFMAVQHKIMFPEELEGGRNLVDEICGYPNVGDMRAVRPSIRAFETSIFPTDETKAWSDQFWKECWDKTDPAPIRDFRSKKMYDTSQLIHELIEKHKLIEDNFYRTTTHKPFDAKHYLIHTLPIYALYLCVCICRGDIHRRAESIILLRVLAETVINFGYLYAKDQDDLWLSYESYGRGKAKEAFVKYLEMGDVPRFVDMRELDALVNEAQWLEFQSIDLSHWDKTNLRKMSEESGLKDIYDKYYILPSAYIHAHWLALDNLLLSFNLNPLHRYKKVMFGMNLRYKSTIYDALVLLNKALSIFAEQYPDVNLMFSDTRLQEIGAELDEYDRRVKIEDLKQEDV